MLPSEVRAKVLGDHDELRRLLLDLERHAQSVLEDSQEGQMALRKEAEDFLEVLAAHLKWEEENLVPVLRESDAWGAERVKRLLDEHVEQKETLDHLLKRLRDPRRPEPQVGRDVLDLVDWLRRDMEGEEAEALDPKVLRDDVVAIDCEAG